MSAVIPFSLDIPHVDIPSQLAPYTENIFARNSASYDTPLPPLLESDALTLLPKLNNIRVKLIQIRTISALTFIAVTGIVVTSFVISAAFMNALQLTIVVAALFFVGSMAVLHLRSMLTKTNTLTMRADNLHKSLQQLNECRRKSGYTANQLTYIHHLRYGTPLPEDLARTQPPEFAVPKEVVQRVVKRHESASFSSVLLQLQLKELEERSHR